VGSIDDHLQMLFIHHRIDRVNQSRSWAKTPLTSGFGPTSYGRIATVDHMIRLVEQYVQRKRIKGIGKGTIHHILEYPKQTVAPAGARARCARKIELKSTTVCSSSKKNRVGKRPCSRGSFFFFSRCCAPADERLLLLRVLPTSVLKGPTYLAEEHRQLKLLGTSIAGALAFLSCPLFFLGATEMGRGRAQRTENVASYRLPFLLHHGRFVVVLF